MKLDLPAPIKLPPQWIPAVSRVWAVGQLLNVIVIGPADQNSTLLKIGTETVVASGAAPVAMGDRFTARVVSLHPLPVLEPVRRESVKPDARVEAVALRTLLPQQIALAPALRTLEAHLPGLARAAHSRDLHALILSTQSLFADIPALAALTTPAKLMRAVTLSGTGLEQTLAGHLIDPTISLPTADRKWQLLSLLRQVEPFLPSVPTAAAPLQEKSVLSNESDLTRGGVPRAEPPAFANWDLAVSEYSSELKQALEGMIARITTRQLQMTEAASLGQAFGLFELPVRIDEQLEVLQLQYSREGEDGQSHGAERHSLLIVVPLPGPSQLRVRLTLCAEQLSIVAWADNEALRVALYHRRDDLQARLAACGLRVEAVIVAPVDGPRDAAHLPQGLIDMKV